MYWHGPSCLEGPVSRTLGRWSGNHAPAAEPKRSAQGDSSGKQTPEASEIRTELVERIRREIADGHYDTPQKWEAALESLLQRLQDAELTN